MELRAGGLSELRAGGLSSARCDWEVDAFRLVHFRSLVSYVAGSQTNKCHTLRQMDAKSVIHRGDD